MPKQATQAAIDALRAAIEPEAYKAQLEALKADLLTNAASLLARLDLNNASPNLDEVEREMGNTQIGNTLVEIQWRLGALTERIGEFETARDAFKRPLNRAQKRAAKKASPAYAKIVAEALRNTEEE